MRTYILSFPAYISFLCPNLGDFAPALITLGYIEYNKGNYHESIALAKKVIEQSLDNVDLSSYTRAYLIIAAAEAIRAQKGGLWSKIVHGPKISRYLDKAEQLQPDSSMVLYARGSFYLLVPGIIGGNLNKAFELEE